MLAMGWCVLAHAGATTLDTTGPAPSLDRIESLRTIDHPRFAQMLAQFHREAPRLTTAEQWHLRYLDAWEILYEGDGAKSADLLRNVIKHSGDAVLATKASALLLNDLAFNQHYEEAYELANRLVAGLPAVKNPQARLMLLDDLSQVFDYAGQTDLALRYAHKMEMATPSGESLCIPLFLQAAALYNGKHLTPASPEMQQAISACVASRNPVDIDTVGLILDALYLDEGQPGKALAQLERLAPDLRASNYYPHLLSAQAKRAMAYAMLGRDDAARKAALAVVAMGHPGDVNEWLRDAYDVLYKVEKKQGHAVAALDYHEHYMAQDKGYLNDVGARALAYETAKQHVLAETLEAEKLGRLNAELHMRQALVAKTVETNRLYIALLLLALASGAIWMFRLKRSQLRFKKLSHLDGLTAVSNRQHFMGEAEHVLHQLERRPGMACLAFIDLDHFKRINDTHGHATGDEVLCRVVAAARQHLRPVDLFGRLGGEEFGILLVECSREQGMTIAERIRQAIEAILVESDGVAVVVSTSIGLAHTDNFGHDLRCLCTEADAALYRAKRGGRNRVVADAEDDADHLAAI